MRKADQARPSGAGDARSTAVLMLPEVGMDGEELIWLVVWNMFYFPMYWE